MCMSVVWTPISYVCHSNTFVCSPYVTRMYLCVIRMSLVSSRMSSICYLRLIVCHLYVSHMYLYVINMSLECTLILSVCDSYVFKYHPNSTLSTFLSCLSQLYRLVCYANVSLMQLYPIPMSLECTRMSSVYHLHVLVCHPYVNNIKQKLTRRLI